MCPVWQRQSHESPPSLMVNPVDGDIFAPQQIGTHPCGFPVWETFPTSMQRIYDGGSRYADDRLLTRTVPRAHPDSQEHNYQGRAWGNETYMAGVDANVSVMVVTADRSLGVRVARMLASTEALQVLAQTSDILAVPTVLQRQRPDLLLCDIATALDPDFIALFASTSISPLPKLVLLAEDSRSTGAGIPVPLAALLPLDLPAGEMIEYLRTLVGTAAEAPPHPPPPEQRATPAARPVDQQCPRNGVLAKMRRSGRGYRPFPPPTDTRTGLPGSEAVAPVIGSVQRMGYPITVIAIDLRFARGSVVPTDATLLTRIERWIGTTLRVAVRDDDMVLPGIGVDVRSRLPGLHQDNHSAVLGRIGRVVGGMDLSRLTYGLRLDTAIGVGYPETGLAEEDLLREACHQAQRAHRAAHTDQ